MQATSRYFLRVFGPGPTRIGVSSAHTTRARMTSARISLFAAATPRAARASSACTNPSDGRAPHSDSMMSAHRATGTWCITSRNTHSACRCNP